MKAKMNRAAMKRVDSPTEQENDQRLAEEELARLHRQYRIVESHRKTYFEEARNIIRKQKSHIDSLSEEGQEIDIDLRLALNQTNLKKDKANMQRLQKLLALYQEDKATVAEEEGVITKLDEKVRELERMLQKKYKDLGGFQVDSIRHVSTQKRIRVLENRLDKATVAFNTMLTKNLELRERIEHLRRERAIYDKLYRILSKEQNELKCRITEMIEEATAAYDMRDEAQAKMSAIRERSEREQTLYGFDIKELKRIIDHDQKLKDFMAVKCQERTEMKAIEAAKRKKKEDKKANERAHKEEIEQFERAFERVRGVTGQNDLDRMVHDFIKKEDVNFALFNYVNELNSEVEVLHDVIGALNADIEAFQKQGMKLDQSRQNILKELETRFTSAERQCKLYEKRLKRSGKLLDQLKTAVDRTFRRLGCDDTAICDLLGSGRGISARNIMMYLGQIEQTTNDLMLIQHFLQLKEVHASKGDAVQPTLQPKPTGSIVAARLRPAPRVSISIMPPSLEPQEGVYIVADEVEEPVQDEVQPLTLDELKQKVVKTIRKKEVQPKKVKEAKGQTEAQSSPSSGTKDLKTTLK
ncbi:coiled-coil domain-containing protein 63-like [Acanthaster planci]|uniref:Coiled-coil domain-containing protein 63-like n=1 Tax=Acanthaster planci TaxID=133434 RepID=A0A8B7Z657_ACAPL|nr:coiled-coil domain-containing protein 63-like [Acanthaster planci]